MAATVLLAAEDPQQDGVLGYLHLSALHHRAQQSPSGGVAQPDREQASENRENDIAHHPEPFAVAREVQRLQAKRGKRRETAAYPDHHELTNGGIDEKAALRSREAAEGTDDERAADIHHQRAPGKVLAESARDDTRTPVPGHPA